MKEFAKIFHEVKGIPSWRKEIEGELIEMLRLRRQAMRCSCRKTMEEREDPQNQQKLKETGG